MSEETISQEFRLKNKKKNRKETRLKKKLFPWRDKSKWIDN